LSEEGSLMVTITRVFQKILDGVPGTVLQYDLRREC
jgi:hypothetical protein